MKRICVFCGSSPGARPEYLQAARALGLALVSRGLGLVYGGASVGMMGALATTVLDAGSDVVGVMPRMLVEKEVALTTLSDLRVVDSMHERKALMAELADGFIALPGGFGTFEEFFEVITWAQLSLHLKPCGLLNVCGYYDALITFLDHAVQEHFVQSTQRAMVLVDHDPAALLEQFVTYQAPQIDKAKWILQLNNRVG
ncbi:MAG: TIGR00730 family Rossman fold protein [Anaerolineae bacterium]|nr:TIGR00730 family Rossman fold protein [Anaerolineae bacterium]